MDGCEEDQPDVCSLFEGMALFKKGKSKFFILVLAITLMVTMDYHLFAHKMIRRCLSEMPSERIESNDTRGISKVEMETGKTQGRNVPKAEGNVQRSQKLAENQSKTAENETKTADQQPETADQQPAPEAPTREAKETTLGKAKRIAKEVIEEFKKYDTSKKVLFKVMSDRGCKEYERAANMPRPVITDILAHAQYIANDSEFVTLIGHMTDDRLSRLEEILYHWNGPVSIAIYLNMDHVLEVVRSILEIAVLQHRHNILLHIVPEQGVFYPVNFLRNVAINNTKTRYIFLSDIDFIPVIGAHNILLEDLQSMANKKQVFIVPAFQESQMLTYDFPQNKSDLIPLWEKGIIKPFHLGTFPPGHYQTNFTRWKDATEPYKILWKPLFEPYIAGFTQALPRYSQMFVGRGMNKIQQILETVAMGFEMFVEPEIFMVHISHRVSHFKAKEEGCSHEAMRKFKNYIIKKYGMRM